MVYISIGNNARHQTTHTMATRSHTRNIITAGGSNNHVANDAHNDAVAMSGICKRPCGLSNANQYALDD